MRKKFLVTLIILLIAFGILTRFFSLNKDYASEELDFVKPAEAIKNTGHPIFYHSEQQPQELALWHPPMYIFLLSFIFRVYDGEIGARMINLVASILVSIAIFLFCTKLIDNKNNKTIGILASAFFLINYYILSSSVQIDIDMLSALFCFSFLFFVLMLKKHAKTYFAVLASIALFFGLCNRYPIAILLYFCIGFYLVINKDLRKNIRGYILIGVVSAALFLIIWGVYSTIIEPGNFFSFLTHNVRFGAEQLSNLTVYLGSFILNLSQLVRLVTLPVIILMILSSIYFIKNKNKLMNFLLIYQFSIFILFLLIPRPAFGYPRYFLTMFPASFIILSVYIYQRLRDIEMKKITIPILCFLISLFLLVMISPQQTVYNGNGLIRATNLPDFILNIFASIPIIFVFLYKRVDRAKMAVVILLFLSISYSLYFDITLVKNDIQSKEAGIYIKEMTNDSDIIIAPKAIAYYAQRRFYVNENNKPRIEFSLGFLARYIKKSIENREMDDAFFWPKGEYGGLYPPIPPAEKLEKVVYAVTYYKIDGKIPERKFGDFYIYRTNN